MTKSTVKMCSGNRHPSTNSMGMNNSSSQKSPKRANNSTSEKSGSYSDGGSGSGSGSSDEKHMGSEPLATTDNGDGGDSVLVQAHTHCIMFTSGFFFLYSINL